MIAILLAAGLGRRLGEMGRDVPKCLIQVNGGTLLQRHLRAFDACGVDRVRVVTGYHADRVNTAIDQVQDFSGQVDGFFNDRYEHGNVLSLLTGLDGLDDDEPIIVMDADVLYPHLLLRRLIDSEHATCLLVDTSSEFSGEEMMIAIGGGRVKRVTRQCPPGDWDIMGETVGFLKVEGAKVSALRAAIEKIVAEGRIDAEYEEAYDEYFAPRHKIGHEHVDDLPWTEIDFPDDVERAINEVLPHVEALDKK